MRDCNHPNCAIRSAASCGSPIEFDTEVDFENHGRAEKLQRGSPIEG